MQVETKKIVEYCEDYLKVKEWQDLCHNGLQVEGTPKVSRIITGVSLSQEIINIAIKKRAKLIMVHHGFFNRHFPEPIRFTSFRKDRLKLLLANNINLAGFHLPLDAHPVIGNNISLLKLLGLKKIGVIHAPKYGDIGFIGEYAESKSFEEFYNTISDKLETQPYVVPAGPRKVKRVGIISGAAANDFEATKELGADLYLTGELYEGVIRAIEELKINVVAAGHYNTEKLGIQNLGDLIAKKFNVKVEFIDIPCDI